MPAVLDKLNGDYIMREEIFKLKCLANQLRNSNEPTFKEHKPHQETVSQPKKKPKKKVEPKKKEEPKETDKEADIEFIKDPKDLPEGAREITNVGFINSALRDQLSSFIHSLKEGLPEEAVREQFDTFLSQNMTAKNEADQVSFAMRPWASKDFSFGTIATWVCAQKTVYKDTLEDAY